MNEASAEILMSYLVENKYLSTEKGFPDIRLADGQKIIDITLNNMQHKKAYNSLPNTVVNIRSNCVMTLAGIFYIPYLVQNKVKMSPVVRPFFDNIRQGYSPIGLAYNAMRDKRVLGDMNSLDTDLGLLVIREDTFLDKIDGKKYDQMTPVIVVASDKYYNGIREWQSENQKTYRLDEGLLLEVKKPVSGVKNPKLLLR